MGLKWIDFDPFNYLAHLQAPFLQVQQIQRPRHRLIFYRFFIRLRISFYSNFPIYFGFLLELGSYLRMIRKVEFK